MQRFRPLALRRLPLAAAIVLVLGGCGEAPAGPVLPMHGALVTFVFDGHPADTLRVHITHPVTVSEAQGYVLGGDGPYIPIGTIRPGAGVDARYPFHFEPESVRLAEAAMELCDGAPMRDTAAVRAFMAGVTGHQQATSATWCPWAARPIAVEQLPTG